MSRKFACCFCGGAWHTLPKTQCRLLYASSYGEERFRNERDGRYYAVGANAVLAGVRVTPPGSAPALPGDGSPAVVGYVCSAKFQVRHNRSRVVPATP